MVFSMGTLGYVKKLRDKGIPQKQACGRRYPRNPITARQEAA
jgi:hypothetical protein